MADRTSVALSAHDQDAKATCRVTGDASWNRIKELFQAVIEREPNDRDAFLEEACGDDRTLQREVESLLNAHGEAGNFAERPAIEVLAESTGGNGPYHLLSPLGEGGMGEVYRARDTTLGRDVAIKILPPIFAVDPNRLARFDREAHLLASLNHPNICAIYGIAEINGTPGLVLELVEGPTLAERIAAAAAGRRRTFASSPEAGAPRSIAVSEALTIALDIARALEAAHEKGVIHRDLKPANIKITPDGIVKVLDFGLAKASADSASGTWDPASAGLAVVVSDGDPTHATDLTATGSQDGVLIGTAPYMSPEQARGEPTDKRTDIWSFGCVLYEMLTGRRAMTGATVAETIAAVLEGEPDWTALPATTPPSVQRLARRCLEKDVKRRLKDIGDARLEIEDALAAGDVRASNSVGAGVPATTSRHAWPWLLAAALGLGAALFPLWSRSASHVPAPELRRVSAQFGTDASLVTFEFGEGSAVILSPDGTKLAFVAQKEEGATQQIYVRSLDQLQAAPVVGTDGAVNPFFSPDGRWIGFFADGKLKRISVSGGGAVSICDVVSNRGGTWADDDTIIFAPNRANASLWRVSSSGGTPEPLTTLADGEITQRWPQVLPGGKAVLFTGNARADGFEDANVVVQPLPKGVRRVVVRGAYFGRYVPSGHLLYIQHGTLFAAPFDLGRLELTGPAVPAIEDATVNMPVGAAEVAVSSTGTVAYLPAPKRTNYMDLPIDWMDRDGRSTPLRTTPARWLNPHFAPDGRRLAFDLFDGVQHDVWIYDWSRDALSRLTFDPADDTSPVWTPDGHRIVFVSNRDDRLQPNLYWQRVDGTGEVQRLTESKRSQAPGSWHPNGRILALATSSPDLMILRLEGDETSGWRPTTPTVFMKGADDPMFSPDGRWLAYVSLESGRKQVEVYVQPFPGPGGRWQISTGGGTNPAWSRTRHELFFATPDHRIMAASYSATGDSFHADKPHLLSDARFSPLVVGRSFDVHPDGNRFALVKGESEAHANRDHITLIFNFFDELRRIAPAGK